MAADDPSGILPAHMIAALADAGHIRAPKPFDADQVQPASLDLRLGPIAWRVRASFLPGPDETVADRIEALKLHEIDLTPAARCSGGAAASTSCRCMEELALPADIAAAPTRKARPAGSTCSPASSPTAPASSTPMPAGYAGPLYVEISPRTFSVVGAHRLAATQIRFRRGHARASTTRRCAALHRQTPRRRRASCMSPTASCLSIDLGGRRAAASSATGAKRHTGADRRRPARRSTTCSNSGSRSLPTAARELDPRPRRVLHPRLARGGHGAARLRRRDGALRPAGRRVPRPLCRLLRSRASATPTAGGAGSRARARGALPRGAVHAGARPDRRPAGLRAHAGTAARSSTAGDIGSHYQAQGLKLSKHFRVG